MVAGPNPAFWQGKRVLVTGHTGFKGAWLTTWLAHLGAEIVGVSLPPATEPSLFSLAKVGELCDSRLCDIRNAEPLGAVVRDSEAEIVLHLAAQALVRESYATPIETFATNVLGTAHLLEAVRTAPRVRTVVVITTDKVYRNEEWAYPYRETDPLGGHDPYSASKASAEIVAACYRASFLKVQNIALATARAGNVIGGGDWSADRLLPDAVRAWGRDVTLRIRRPDAVRPWQHVLEPAAAYLRLAERLSADRELATAFNFGPRADEAASVRTVIELASESYGRGAVEFDTVADGPHEAGLLTLETAKARQLLDVAPRWTLGEAVERTMLWYKAVDAGRDARTACLDDIHAFGDLD